MNKLAKKMANREGFTLVELIVVIAILGILAGIAIPVYSGYIAKANEAADLQALDAIKTAAVFAAVDADEGHDCQITSMTVTANSQTVSVTGTNLKIGDATNTASVNVSAYTTVPASFKVSGKTSYTWDGTNWS